MNIVAMCRQSAVYWPPGPADAYGQPTHGDPIEIDVRWQDRTEEFLDKEGRVQLSRAIVYCSQGLVLGGYLFLGTYSDLSSADENDPTVLNGAWPIRLTKRSASIDNRHELFKLVL